MAVVSEYSTTFPVPEPLLAWLAEFGFAFAQAEIRTAKARSRLKSLKFLFIRILL
jgi:hypothetical protein